MAGRRSQGALVLEHVQLNGQRVDGSSSRWRSVLRWAKMVHSKCMRKFEKAQASDEATEEPPEDERCFLDDENPVQVVTDKLNDPDQLNADKRKHDDLAGSNRVKVSFDLTPHYCETTCGPVHAGYNEEKENVLTPELWFKREDFALNRSTIHALLRKDPGVKEYVSCVVRYLQEEKDGDSNDENFNAKKQQLLALLPGVFSGYRGVEAWNSIFSERKKNVKAIVRYSKRAEMTCNDLCVFSEWLSKSDRRIAWRMAQVDTVAEILQQCKDEELQ